QTPYGLSLVIKLTLVAATLAAAAVSRLRLRQQRVPLRSIRIEGSLTVAILVFTALLSMTAPPPQAHAPTTHADHDAGPVNDSVQMSLGDQGNRSEERRVGKEG